MHENDAELMEKDKRRNLSGGHHRTSAHIEDAPGWNECLATASEANVKADRSTTPIGDLPEKTINHLYSRHHPDERPEATGASYVRDEVAGPLGSAEAGEFEEEVDSDLENIDSDGRTVTRRIIREKVEIKK
ncbi:hypothetical protein SCLCIDRAFT_1213482 [Scleroderma citrinum Foug A]|uniref:Uncharacterized protein n=1 Tax=Scleroderma citrinum Foug A TaxID=1036808 RepID=A0A0C3DUT4_9AGAM|nr:hypothetical protein SCLCIDRAFT_1213482 [Scleroderma citrinum Foug A]